MAKTIKKPDKQEDETTETSEVPNSELVIEADIEIDDLPTEAPKGKSLKDTMKLINKKFGDKTMITLGEIPDFPRLPSGVHAIDYTIGGGFPITHSSCLLGGASGGKTTLALSTLAVSQVLCMRCYRPEKYCACSVKPLLMDAAIANVEGTLDNTWAKTLGVDINRVYPIQADSTEMYIDILDQVLQSDDCGLAIFDSIGALVAMAEMDKAAEASNMGVSAKLITKLAKRMKQRLINETKRGHQVTLLYINQKRMKLNAAFGCLSYDTLINFTDGRSLPIGKVVDEKIVGSVWSLNEATGEVESKKIIGWHYNGKVDKNTDFIHIQTQAINSGGGRFGITVTPDHKLLTDTGWKTAKTVSSSDRLISKYTETINDTYKDFLSGILVGDSHITTNKVTTARLCIQDSINREYAAWKVGKLSSIMAFNKVPLNSSTVNNGTRYVSSPSYELARLRRSIGKRNPNYLLDNLTPMGFALWLMDDGHFNDTGHYRYSISIKRFKNNTIIMDEIANKLSLGGFPCTPKYSGGFIAFPTKITDKIAEYICQYVPPSMQYKLPPQFRGRYCDFTLNNTPTIKTDTVSVLMTRHASPRQMRNKRKFDITVEGNHNYMAGGVRNGVIVHNSPETSPGGEAFLHEQSIILRNGKVSFNDAEKKVYKSKVDTDRDPATKHSIIVHKAKVYTLGASCQYVRSSDYKHPTIGDTSGKAMDFKFLIEQAKSSGILGDDPKKLTFMDKDYKTQIELMQQLNKDPQDKLFMSMLVVQKAKQDRLNS